MTRRTVAAGLRKVVLRWEAADTVTWLAAALLLVIFAILAALVWRGYDRTLTAAEERTQVAADTLAGQMRWLVGAALTVLDQAAAAGPAEAVPAGAVADTLRARLGVAAAVAVYGPDGRLVSASAPADMPAAASAEEFFAVLAGGEVSVLGQEAGGAGRSPRFVVARALRAADGGFAGALAVALPADILMTLWAPQRLGPGSTMSIVRADGLVLARHPALQEPVRLGDLPVMATLNAAAAGSYESPRSPVDGVARIVSFRHEPALGFIGIAAISRAAELAGLWTATRTVLLLMAPIALALLAGSFLTARLLRSSARTQRNLSAALAQNELLFREIHHRVKNNLQSVSNLLRMQPIPQEIKTEMSQRIAAMAGVHEHLYRSNNFATVRLDEYIRTLIDDIKAGQAADATVQLELDELSVDKEAAVPLGLIVNEVVTNAFKHGFADGRRGVVQLKLAKTGPDRAHLTVEDNGPGFDPSQPSKGIGRRLITALARQLGGEASYASPAGSRFDLSFPLAGTSPLAQAGAA